MEQNECEAISLRHRWLNLGPPDSDFISNTFGQINSTATPARIMQLGSSLVF